MKSNFRKRRIKRERKRNLKRNLIRLTFFVLVPELIAIFWGIYSRGYFAVGGELILPILGIFCLSRVEIQPEPTPQRELRRAQIGS